MTPQDLDAEVLTHVSRRLFAEARAEFRAAHKGWTERCEVLTIREFIRSFDEALEKERRAMKKQREAIRLQSMALDLRAEKWVELKAKSGG